jgi:hypothetical protein
MPLLTPGAHPVLKAIFIVFEDDRQKRCTHIPEAFRCIIGFFTKIFSPHFSTSTYAALNKTIII